MDATAVTGGLSLVDATAVTGGLSLFSRLRFMVYSLNTRRTYIVVEK